MRWLIVACFVGFFARTAATQRLWVVGPTSGPGVDFTVIQQAITAAADGDTVEVRAGTYDAGLMILAKGLVLIGRDVTLRTALGGGVGIRVEDTRAGQSVVVSGFTYDGDVTSQMALVVRGCRGPVMIQNCSFRQEPTLLRDGAQIYCSYPVTISGCSFAGSSRPDSAPLNGLSITDSFVVMTDTVCSASGSPRAGVGAAGVVLYGGLQAYRCTFQGGRGAAANATASECIARPGDGGPAVAAYNGSALLNRCTLRGGPPGHSQLPCPPGSPGPWTVGNATLFDGPRASMSGSSIVALGSSVRYDFTADPGDSVLLVLSSRSSSQHVYQCRGPVYGFLPTTTILFVAVAPPTGNVALSMSVPANPSINASTVFLQALAANASACTLGSTLAVTMVR